MEKVTKVYFDPLAASKAQIRAMLQELPIGSAHPFSPERLLLCRTETGVDEIDISSYPETHFFNAVDLGELGQTLQRRMTKFASQLRIFNDEYTVQQAPTSVFKVPIEKGKIAILAVSQRYPTYYDLCVADASCRTSCYNATTTFTGMHHSGDIDMTGDLLHHITIDERLESGKELAIFVSGFSQTKLTRFQESTPVVMVANHAEKALYIVPVPLDQASIGDATICTPVVIKREEDMLFCSMLPAPTTDLAKSCEGSTLQSTSFNEAIRRAAWTIAAPPTVATNSIVSNVENLPTPSLLPQDGSLIANKKNVVFITQTTVLPPFIESDLTSTQLVRFGTGLEFLHDNEKHTPQSNPSAVVLPCVLGSRLEGSLLLATGKTPKDVPFHDEQSLRTCYEQFKNVVVFVDERMADNARNLASPWRINAVFVIQMDLEPAQQEADISTLLDLLNINAVTALAGPQSLILVQVGDKYHFYRGIVRQEHFNSSNLAFGADVTRVVESTKLNLLLYPKVKRMVNLREVNSVLLPNLGQTVRPQDLQSLFHGLSLDQILCLESDISAIVPQLQVLLNQKDLAELSQSLSTVLSNKVHDTIAPVKDAYVKFLTGEYDMGNPESVKKKNRMLSELRKYSKDVQTCLETIISHLSNMMSAQMTSKRTHDLQRLERQAAIKNNVDAVKSMTFETLAGLLDTKAEEMGVLLLNIQTAAYKQILGNLKADSLNAEPCCELDSRTLHLVGIDAGIVIEQSQSSHEGPLKHQLGATHPNLALGCPGKSDTSMLAWVCWDEFVTLKNPFTVRWMEKCNDSHIAALRIMMRDTLSRAVVSRDYNMQPANPETGQLMSALLMAAMSKLAGMRNTAPTRAITAEDTITKLMRGLFGNLLTTAGSGVRPMSMVWQLFGLEPKLEVPTTLVAWNWYEMVVMLYPYTGWPERQFNQNLEKLLTKALLNVITKNELTGKIKASRVEWMVKYCQLRNIQLEHSRTFATIFIRMMNEDVENRKAVATRLLDILPPRLERQSQSYSRMMGYLKYVASTGLRREGDDIIIVSVYIKRSAVFKKLKQAAAKACKGHTDSDNGTEIKKCCQAVLDKFNEIAESWELEHAKLIMQNVKAYQGLLECDWSEDADESIKSQRKDLMQRVLSDAEKLRIRWQVGKAGEFGDDIEPLDENLLHEIMTGEKETDLALKSAFEPVEAVEVLGMKRFADLVNPDFVFKVDNVLTPSHVCSIMKVPETAMRVFARALNPAFDFEKDLGVNFKTVVMALLADRSEREKQQPVRKLFEMDKKTLEVKANGE